METDEETTEYNLRLDAAQMLQAIAEVNSKAASIPEALNNINLALEQFSKKYGISLASAQKEMAATILDAENLRKVLENPIAAPTVLLNPNANSLAQTPNPFEQIGMSTQGGLQALNDQRKEGIVLSQQQARSEALVAKEINAEVSDMQKAVMLDEEWAAIVKERQLAEEANRQTLLASARAKREQYEQQTLGKQFPPISGNLTEEEYAANKAAIAQMNLADKAKKAGDAGEDGAKRATKGIDVLRTALHLLVASAIFAVINGFQKLFTEAIAGLKSLEVSVYNLANAERAMSQSGIDVTFKDLEGVVDRLSKKFDGLFSKVQLQDIVADISIATKELGLNAKQIEQIAASAAALQLRNPGKSIQEVNQQLLTAILSGQTKGIRSLGVAASEAAIQQEALSMGLIKVGETANAQQKSLATLSLVYKATAGDAKNLEQYQNTLTGVQQQLKSAWQDLLAEVAKTYAPEIIQGFKVIINALQLTLVIFKALEPAIQKVVTLIASFVAGLQGLGGLNPLEAVKKFAKQFLDAKEGYQKYFESFNNSPDTPTLFGGKGDSEAAAKQAEMLKEQEDKLTEIFKDARDKREDIERNYQEKLADIALNYSQKLEDIARTTAQKTADAQRDYADKVTDINRDAEQKKADARTEAHKKEIDAERQYQDELKKLREKYLMDLEDALHERDARQILRLMRQYQFDKNNLKKQREAEQQKAKEELAQKMQDIENERKLKLEQAKRDLADKLRDIQTAAARERQEAAINYQRQLADAAIAHRRAIEEQRIYLQRKLRDLADALAREYNLTANQLRALHTLYAAYANSGVIPTSSLGGVGAPTSPSSTNVSTSSVGSPIGNPSSPSSVNGGLYNGGMAEGGTFLATRPQTIAVGESRPEVITATPLGKPGQDVSKIFANGGLGGMGGGQIEIAMSLSPDLEARIVRNTLDETANIVTRINRSKS